MFAGAKLHYCSRRKPLRCRSLSEGSGCEAWHITALIVGVKLKFQGFEPFEFAGRGARRLRDDGMLNVRLSVKGNLSNSASTVGHDIAMTGDEALRWYGQLQNWQYECREPICL